jgi:hypothetical protein
LGISPRFLGLREGQRPLALLIRRHVQGVQQRRDVAALLRLLDLLAENAALIRVVLRSRPLRPGQQRPGLELPGQGVDDVVAVEPAELAAVREIQAELALVERCVRARPLRVDVLEPPVVRQVKLAPGRGPDSRRGPRRSCRAGRRW